MVLVSLLVDQLSGLFLIFFGRPKTTFSKKTGQKIQKSEQKFPETGQFFFGRPKKNEKKTGQLVDQETDQNHMDGTIVYWT